MTKTFVRLSVAAVVAVSISACGSKAPRPISELALTDSALQSAETAGAREYAPIELRIAREKKEAADLAMQRKDFKQAKHLTLEAKVDAELARAAAEAEKSRLALKEAQDNIEMMREEVTRTSGQ